MLVALSNMLPGSAIKHHVVESRVLGYSGAVRKRSISTEKTKVTMAIDILRVVDSDSSAFQQECGSVDVVCVGDSITGWNNYGPAKYWPFPTYPRFLQEHCQPLQLRLADGGIAGEVSDNGLAHVNRYLRMFPAAKHYIVGFGTNDLGTWPSFREASERILDNLGQMIDAIESLGAKPILFNVPPC